METIHLDPFEHIRMLENEQRNFKVTINTCHGETFRAVRVDGIGAAWIRLASQTDRPVFIQIANVTSIEVFFME